MDKKKIRELVGSQNQERNPESRTLYSIGLVQLLLLIKRGLYCTPVRRTFPLPLLIEGNRKRREYGKKAVFESVTSNQ